MGVKWVNQGEIGVFFALTALEVGNVLKVEGLKLENGNPSAKAFEEGLAACAPWDKPLSAVIPNCTPKWNLEKLLPLFEKKFGKTISEQELNLRSIEREERMVTNRFSRHQSELQQMQLDLSKLENARQNLLMQIKMLKRDGKELGELLNELKRKRLKLSQSVIS